MRLTLLDNSLRWTLSVPYFLVLGALGEFDGVF